MKQRNLVNYLLITLKGMAMGAADVVPGVSGGTIAFISGIYVELINSINAINFSLFSIWKKDGFKTVWKTVNGNFLFALFLGIAISIFSLAKVLSWLLTNEPILLWAFFFGLVLASVIFVAKAINKWTILTFMAFGIGAILAFYITTLPVSDSSSSLAFLFLSGALAVCAMILPGISGAFILVLLGSYKTILDAVHERNILIIATVGIGAVVGLLSFARLLKWMFLRFKNTTLALLTGFILGSLNKIWPWKKVLEYKSFGDKVIPVKEANIYPLDYEGDPQILFAILLAILGFALIFILENLAKRDEN